MDYRREIDGLRALAVVPVILFHAGFELFGGGFVGVDVFFVISGYLITTILLAELQQGKFSIVGFYERRARRILPALFPVMLVCIPFAWLWMYPSDMKDFSQSLLAVSVFSSNILFWRESGYFDATAELKPLLHTWSLAVEEQYYVFFPLFLMFFWRFGRRLILILLAAFFVVSLSMAQWGSLAKSAASFFLLPARGWELLIGAFAAFYLSKSNRIELGRAVGEVAGWLGLVLIMYAIFAYSKETPFPGLYALVPTAGAMLIILFATQQTTIGKFLGNSAFVGIGLVSYSAYLWHQPLFAFARYGSSSEPGKQIFAALSIAAIVLAYFSWRYVESPFRVKGNLSRKSVFICGFAGICFFMALGVVGHVTEGFKNYYLAHRAEPTRRDLLSYIEYNRTEEFKAGYRFGSCFYGSQFDSFGYYKKSECLDVSEGKSNYLLIGDSHAAHWSGALRKNFPHLNILQATASGCRPLISYSGEKRCTDLVRYAFNEFLVGQEIKGVILSARWQSDELDDLAKTVSYLLRYVDSVIVLGPTVEYQKALPYLLMGGESRSDVYSKYVTHFVVPDRKSLSDDMRRALSGTKADYVAVFDELCGSDECRVYDDGGKPIAWDYGHFTLAGADFVMKKLISENKIKLD